MVDTLKNKDLTAIFKLINTNERFINNIISQLEHGFGNLIFAYIALTYESNEF